jgi:ribulose-phosphate 3-epimerase
MLIDPSLISGDLLNLEQQIKELDSYADGYHLDIMDYHFVPNLTWGPIFINAIAQVTIKPLFIHLMVDDPQIYFDRLELRENDTVSFHAESCLTTPVACNPVSGAVCPSYIDYEYIQELIEQLHAKKLNASVALKPGTGISSAQKLLPMVDDILCMTVEPGFSGQQFLPASFDKIQDLVYLRNELNSRSTITVDGGVSANIIARLDSIGANRVAVAGALFLNNQVPLDALKKLKELVQKKA